MLQLKYTSTAEYQTSLKFEPILINIFDLIK